MKVTALGSSGGRTPGHALSSFMLGNDTLLDVGGACSVLDEAAQLGINRILISHPHLDHIYSLAFILETMAGHGREPIEIISSREVLKIIASDFLNGEVWPDFAKPLSKTQPGLANYRPIEAGKKIRVGPYQIETIDVNHPVPAVGFIVNDNEGTLFYTGDMGPTPAVWKKIRSMKTKINALLTELSFPNQMEALAMMSGHLTPDMLEEGMIEANIVDIPVYLTHLKPNFIETVIIELDRLPRKNIHILQDGNTFRVKKR